MNNSLEPKADSTRDFMSNFHESYVQTFDDAKKGRKELVTCRPVKEWLYSKDGLLDLNKKGAGIYFTPNPCRGGRSEENVTELRWLYVDIDGGDKEGQYQLVAKCPLPPTAVVESKNGLHLYWKLLGECTKGDWSDACEGLRQFFGGDDAISSTNEVLRLPGFMHLKDPEHPFKVRLDYYEPSFEYTISQIKEQYPFTHPIDKHAKTISSDSTLEAIKAIPITDVLAKLGVVVKHGFIWEGDEQTSARVYLPRNCITRFSGKQGSGSTIDAVMTWGNMKLADAIKWLKDNYGIQDETPKSYRIERKEKSKSPFTWGTPKADKVITPIQRNHLIIFSGATGTGKTTFSFDMAVKNAKLGHRVAYVTLEMSAEAIMLRRARTKAGITKADWRDREGISKEKKEVMERDVQEIRDIKTFIPIEFGDGKPTTMDDLLVAIAKENPDIVFVDNFDFIQKEKFKDQLGHENECIQRFVSFIRDTQIPVFLIHHFNKSGESGKANITNLRGSGKISHGVDTIVYGVRPDTDEDSHPRDKAAYLLLQQKDRDFGDPGIAALYYRGGTFHDEFIEERTSFELAQDIFK